MTSYLLSSMLCSACGERWNGAQEEGPGDPPRVAGFECPRCHEPAGRIDSRPMIEVVEACSLARRVSLTRVLHDIRHNGPSSFGDVVELADYAVHMRKALAHIIDKSETLEEARLIAAAARMGEEWR